MVITIKLLYTHSSLHTVTFCCGGGGGGVVRKLKIKSLRKFQVYNKVLFFKIFVDFERE